MLRHDAQVRTVEFSPDGRLLVTASDDRTVRVWDVASGVQLRRFAHPRPVRSARFSPDGRLTLTAPVDRDPFARVFDVATGAVATARAPWCSHGCPVHPGQHADRVVGPSQHFVWQLGHVAAAPPARRPPVRRARRHGQPRQHSRRLVRRLRDRADVAARHRSAHPGVHPPRELDRLRHVPPGQRNLGDREHRPDRPDLDWAPERVPDVARRLLAEPVSSATFQPGRHADPDRERRRNRAARANVDGADAPGARLGEAHGWGDIHRHQRRRQPRGQRAVWTGRCCVWRSRRRAPPHDRPRRAGRGGRR